MVCTVHASRLLAFMVAAISTALPFRLDSARAAESATGTVTIEAGRERELKRQINRFVSSTVFTYLNDSLERWNRPVCPLVAGLSREQGEFVLARVSQIARDSHAPVGPEHCKPNLYVVVTDNPDLLLEKWSKRDRRMFNTCNGMGYVKEFLHSRQPVRVYYNARFSSGGGDRDPSALEVTGLRLDFPLSGCASSGAAGTRLSFGAVQDLTSVIVVVDSQHTTNLNMGQLADYVALVGLAQIRLDADTGTAPTILSLFRETDPRPQGLSLWDQSFLQSLYTTSQSSVLEVTMIKHNMFEQIVAHQQAAAVSPPD
jgi:hypothetical protein